MGYNFNKSEIHIYWILIVVYNCFVFFYIIVMFYFG